MNKNGSILNEIINSSNAVILNKKDEFTYYRKRSGYKEILDLVICSSSLYSCINDYHPLNLLFYPEISIGI